MGRGIAIAIGAVVLIWFGTFVGLGGFVGTGSEQSADPQKKLRSNACLAAENFVGQRLKAPATADFSLNCSALDLGTGQWSIRSHVDAQNTFGAKIRTTYVVIATPTDANGREWRLNDMQFY